MRGVRSGIEVFGQKRSTVESRKWKWRRRSRHWRKISDEQEREEVDEKDGQVETEREWGIGKGGKQRREVQRKWLQSRCIETIVTNKEGITENNDIRQKEI